jgi:hypothetical protein
MTKKQEHLPPDEILRRLDVARELLPEYFRKFLSLEAMKEGPGEPQEQAWQWLAALLVNDDKIFERVEAKVADKKRGRPKSDAEAVKHPPEKLVELADAFEKFALRQRQDAARIGNPKPTQNKLVALFQTKAGERFTWLPTSDQTVLRLIRQGKGMRKWPRLFINGRWRILHPTQAAAYRALLKAPLDNEIENARAAEAILSLRYDRDGDLDEMSASRSLYDLRSHGFQSVHGGPPLPLLKRVTEEIRDE